LGYVGLPAGSAKAFRKPGDGESLRDCSECPELLLVPAGRVAMKLTIANVRRDFAIDLPRAFTIGRYEVTRGQFAAFVADSKRRIEPGCHLRAPAWRLDAGLSWQNPGFDQTDDHPVVCVSFEDAQAYVAWLSRKTGQRYRLPTDAEWHYLAAAEDWDRAGADQLCVIGNGADRSAMAANPQWSGTACSDGYVGTAPVGRFARSLWGLHDLNGNAWEWVSTCAPDPKPDAVFPAPTCAASGSRILRGGSFADAPSMRLLDARIVSPPAIRDQVAGFRVLRE
jgi:formylglycine-generating enzyme required for sulfatase activity